MKKAIISTYSLGQKSGINYKYLKNYKKGGLEPPFFLHQRYYVGMFPEITIPADIVSINNPLAVVVTCLDTGIVTYVET